MIPAKVPHTAIPAPIERNMHEKGAGGKANRMPRQTICGHFLRITPRRFCVSQAVLGERRKG